MEHKFLTAPFDVKNVGTNGQFSGRASVYGVRDYYGDVVMPGAFTKSLAQLGGEIVVLNQHDPADPIGKAKLTDRNDGLWATGQLVLDLPSARDAYVRLQSKLISGISIGYETLKESFSGDVRQLHEIRLLEISLVTFPANQFARVTDVKGDADVSAALRRLSRNIRATHEQIREQRRPRTADDIMTSMLAKLRDLSRSIS